MAAHHQSLRIHLMVFLLLLVAGIFSGVVYAQNADVKIACVDIQRAINESKAGKLAKQALTQEVEKIQKLIFEKQKELQEMKDSFDKQNLLLSSEARVSKEKELQARFRDYQRWGEDVQSEMNQKKMEVEKNLSIDLQKIIQKLGADEGYSFILEKNGNIVLFASKPIDITDQVIKAHNAQKK